MSGCQRANVCSVRWSILGGAAAPAEKCLLLLHEDQPHRGTYLGRIGRSNVRLSEGRCDRWSKFMIIIIYTQDLFIPTNSFFFSSKFHWLFHVYSRYMLLSKFYNGISC